MEKLQKAITAIKKGDKVTGKKLLIEVLRADPQNETAWLWMSTVLKRLDQRKECLEKALAINPDNQNAQRSLETIRIKLDMQSGKSSADFRQTPRPAVETAEGQSKSEPVRKMNKAKIDELKGLLRYELSEGAPPNALITRYVKKGYSREVVEEIVLEADTELEPVNNSMPLSLLFFSTEGRIPRSTYWYYTLAIYLISITAFILDLIFGTFNEDVGIGLFTIIMSLIFMLPSYAVSIKRLHDRDRSGWFLLVSIIPLVNIWVWIEVGFLRGTYGENQYGADPLLHNRQRKMKKYTIDKIPPTS